MDKGVYSVTSIQLTLTGAQARAEVDGILTAGMVGVPVTITWDESWEGLMKTLVCRSDGCTRTILNVGNQTTVAPEVFRTEKWAPNALYLGVEGRNAEGKLVIPTTFAYCGQILPGAVAEGAPSQGPENPVWAQILGIIGDMGDLATAQKDSLVEAINEAAGLSPAQEAAMSVSTGYQLSESYNQIPVGTWSASIPTWAAGKYLWTKITLSRGGGASTSVYSVSGGITSVNGIGPDSKGNVILTAAQTGAVPMTGGAMTGPLNMNGQPISGMNPPTASTQAANKGYVDASSSKAVPYNLLNNSDFRNPVNQRGASSYTLGAWGGYTIDRWAAYESGCAVTASDDGIQLNGELYQPISKETARRYNGKTVTIAAKIGGNVYSAHGVVNQAGSYNVTASVDTLYGKLLLTCENANTLFFTIRNNTSAVVEWAALYEGEYTAETLPEYHPKGYAVELAECQRYFQRIEFSWQILAVASPRTAATTRSGMILPQMPRISIPTCTYAGSNAVLVSTEGNKIITELKPVARGNIMRIECTAESVTAGMPYAIYGNSSSEYIDISADL